MSDLSAFRRETRQWLDENCPPSQRTPAKHGEFVFPGRSQTFPSADAQLWFERMRDRGWTCPDFPEEYGGGGLTAEQHKVLKQEMQALGCRPPVIDIGISMLGPALLEFGSEAQKADHIPKIVRGERRWCQGYSEPGAGSDLASLQCKAVDCGDHFLVNGSKIWTSYATEADWIFCLVRTSAEGAKQAGISFLLIDMHARGVSAEPIELISGESEFAQTFFEDVKVPRENLVHKLHEGWTVAKALLGHERKMMAELSENVIGGNLTVIKAAQQYAAHGTPDPALRQAIAEHEMTMRAFELTSYRTYQERAAGQFDARVPLILKYVGTSALQVKDELMVDLLGYRGLGWFGDEFDEDELRASRDLLFNKSLTIAGGTNEIQLNIIAKRALGLPSD